MQQEDDLRALEKIVQFARTLSVVFLILHVYWFGYGWLAEHSLTHTSIDRILSNIERSTGLFSSPIITKLCSLLFLAVGCYGTKSIRDGAVSRSRIVGTFALGLPLFFLSDVLRRWPCDDWCFGGYIAALGVGYLSLLAGGVWIGRLVKRQFGTDPFNIDNESFRQEEQRLDNAYSVNLPTRYYYRGAWRRGWINVVNPFRATMVLGTPGSGKSYAVVNSFIRQQIEKGFSMYIYDFKFV